MNKIPKKCLVDALTIYKSAFGASELIAIEIKSNVCFIDVNNTTMSLRMSFDVDKQADTKEQLVIEADRLLQFLKGGASDTISLSTKKNHTLTIGKTKLTIPISNYKIRAWGLLKSKQKPTVITSAHLFAQIAKNITCFSTGGHYGVLESICIRRVQDDLEIVGTDGYRIGVVHITDNGLDKLNDIDTIVPNTVLSIMCRLVKSSEPCSLFVADDLFRLETTYDTLKIEAAAPQVKEAYPNITPLVSVPPDIEWEVNATDLIRDCNLHKTVGNKIAKAEFKFNEDNIEISSEGMHSIIPDVIRKHDEDYTVNLSLKFVMDAVNLISLNSNERIRLGLSKKTNLIWVRANSGNNSVKTMAVIVPIVG